mgnify:FL=1
MFTIDQLKEANLKVQSGADFPAYVQDLIKLGVVSYDTFVKDGHTSFFGNNNFQLNTEEKYPPIEVSDKTDSEKFKTNLKAHQLGQTHYLSFCKHAAESGVDKWTVDTHALTCTYFDQKENKILTESIPAPQKTA